MSKLSQANTIYLIKYLTNNKSYATLTLKFEAGEITFVKREDTAIEDAQIDRWVKQEMENPTVK